MSSNDPEPSASAAAPSGAACWICLEEGPDETGQPLVRNCACRGESAGFAHLSCIIEYSKNKLNDFLKKWDEGDEGTGPHELTGTADAWVYCFNCKQKYMGDICLSLSKALDESTEHLPETHEVRMLALYYSASGYAREGKYASAISLYETLLRICESNGSLHAIMAMKALGVAYGYQGKYYEALEWYEKARAFIDDISQTEDGRMHMARAQQDIDFEIELMKRRLGMVVIDSSTAVERARQQFQRHVIQRANSATVRTSKYKLISALAADNQYLEALKLCKETVECNERIFGSDHTATMESRDYLTEVKKKYRLYLEGIAKK